MANLLDYKYQLQELIGQSDRNLVYKAYESAMKREVAIKYLSPGASPDPAAVQQFCQEMQQIAGLSDPHILSVYEYGLEEDRLYLVTPYIPGATLQERMYQFYPLERATRLVQALAGALEYVHDQGIVHGNLKPSNILLDEDEQPLLTDFGAFQKIGMHGGLVSPYQSPEQARGDPIDARTDVYTLGVLLHEMLIGQRPRGARLSPHLQRPDLPLEVEQIILTAMAENPRQRFQSVREMNQALDSVMQGETGATLPPVTAKPFWQTIPWWVYALAGVVAVLIAAVLVFSW
ncbi:MAG: protein kinase [Anaerolineae bacterium]|nr:protein kinase [Anaerolineae bacterium]